MLVGLVLVAALPAYRPAPSPSRVSNEPPDEVHVSSTLDTRVRWERYGVRVVFLTEGIAAPPLTAGCRLSY